MRLICLFFLIVVAYSCKQDPASQYVETDLMADGLPIKIMAPPESEVKLEDYGFLKDVTVKKGDNFYIQIMESEADNFDLKAVKAEKLAEVKAGPFFSKILSEEEHGFIFEKKLDEETFNYDFRYVKIQGSNQYLFQRGLIGLFSQEDVEAMYAAVK